MCIFISVHVIQRTFSSNRNNDSQRIGIENKIGLGEIIYLKHLDVSGTLSYIIIQLLTMHKNNDNNSKTLI